MDLVHAAPIPCSEVTTVAERVASQSPVSRGRPLAGCGSTGDN
jgi:hypothetical protein